MPNGTCQNVRCPLDKKWLFTFRGKGEGIEPAELCGFHTDNLRSAVMGKEPIKDAYDKVKAEHNPAPMEGHNFIITPIKKDK